MSNFKITKENGIATIVMDQVGSEVNTLSVSLLDEFKALLDDFENDKDCKAAVLTSGKDNGFTGYRAVAGWGFGVDHVHML